VATAAPAGGTLIATFWGLVAFIKRERYRTGVTVFSCDYNGWTDMKEEEREAVEAFEALPRPPANQAVALPVWVPQPQLSPLRKAA